MFCFFHLSSFFSYETFVAKLAKRMESLQTGNGFDAGVTQGPLIDAAGLAKVFVFFFFFFFFFVVLG